MKNGKRPTVKQCKMISAWGLNYQNWLVSKNTPTEMVIVHRLSGKTRAIPKGE